MIPNAFEALQCFNITVCSHERQRRHSTLAIIYLVHILLPSRFHIVVAWLHYDEACVAQLRKVFRLRNSATADLVCSDVVSPPHTALKDRTSIRT